MSEPFFSVIIPTYNRAGVLRRAIDSVLNQSCGDFELIVVDDGSTDGTAELMKGISCPDLYYYFQDNKGVCAARNSGAVMAKGQYLVFLDSDDILLPEALEVIMGNAQKNNLPDLVFCDMEIKSIDGKESYTSARDRYERGQGVGVFLSGAFAIKRHFFIEIKGYDENINFGENAELKIRIGQKSFTHCMTGRPAAVYCQAADGAGKNYENRIRSNEYIIMKHQDYFEKNKELLKLYLQSNAVLQIRIRKIREARATIRRAFTIDPIDPFLLMRFVFIHVPFLAKKIWK